MAKVSSEEFQEVCRLMLSGDIDQDTVQKLIGKLSVPLQLQDEEASLSQLKADLERECIKRALHESNGDKGQAARMLGMPLKKFLRTMELLGISSA